MTAISIPTGRPFGPEARRSVQVYLGLMLYLVAVKITLTLMMANSGFRSPSQAAVFAWPAIGIFTIAGLIGLGLVHRLGLPGVWSSNVPLRWRLLIPTAGGL